MKYRYRTSGNETLVLAGSHDEVVRNSFGDPIHRTTIQAKKLVFDNGFAQTDDSDIDQLIKAHRGWGTKYYYDPTCVPEDAPKEKKALAKTLADDSTRRARKKKKQQDAAAEAGGSKYHEE